MNQTLNNMVRAMMCQYGSYAPLWGEAMIYATKIKNVMLNDRMRCTPYEAWYGTIPDVSNFRTFGCRAYARIPDETRTKLELKSVPGIYVGPEIHGSGYRVMIHKVNMCAHSNILSGSFLISSASRISSPLPEQAMWLNSTGVATSPCRSRYSPHRRKETESLIALEGTRPEQETIAAWHKRLAGSAPVTNNELHDIPQMGYETQIPRVLAQPTGRQGERVGLRSQGPAPPAGLPPPPPNMAVRDSPALPVILGMMGVWGTKWLSATQREQGK